MDSLTGYEEKIKFWSIITIWFFQVVGVIGISLGAEEWFITKTPFNLLLGFFLMMVNFPIVSLRSIAVTNICFLVGMTAELIGVNQGLLFGSYEYGDNLGAKLGGVPFLIGVNWVTLVMTTAAISTRIFKPVVLRVLTGALLMLGLDFLMEGVAPGFDYWTFYGPPPASNYITWFVIACGLHAIYQRSKTDGDFLFSINLFGSQVFFFAWFYFFS